MAHKHIELFKRAFVEELCDAFACGIFASLVLFLDGFLATAKAGLLAHGDEFLDFFELVAHI